MSSLLQEVLEKNPAVDVELLRSLEAAVKALEELGISTDGSYKVAHPFDEEMAKLQGCTASANFPRAA